jgi:hypothetical protein
MGSKKPPAGKGKKAGSKKLDGGLTRKKDKSLEAENAMLEAVPSRSSLGRDTVSTHLRKFLAKAKQTGDFGPVRQYAERLDVEQQRSPDEPILAPFMEALSQMPSADQSLIREQLGDLESFALPSLRDRDMDADTAAEIESLADDTGAQPAAEDVMSQQQLSGLQALRELYDAQAKLRAEEPDFDISPEGRRLQRTIEKLVVEHGFDEMDAAGPDLTVVDAPEPDRPAGPKAQFRVPNSRRFSTYFGSRAAQGMRLKKELEADPDRALRQLAGEQVRSVEEIEAKARMAANNGSNVDVFATLPKVVTGVSKKQQDAEAMRGVLQAGAETQINDADSLPEELRQPASLAIPIRGNPTDYQIASRNKPQAEQIVERLIKASGASTGSTGLLDTLSKDARGNYSMAETGDAPEGIVNLDKLFPGHRAVFMGKEGDALTHSHAHRTADLVARLITGKLEEALGYELGQDFVEKITPLMQRSMDFADENPPPPKSTAYQWWDKKAQPGQQGMQFLQGLIGENDSYSTRPLIGQAPRVEGPPPPLELTDLEADMDEIAPPPPPGSKSAPPAPIDMGDEDIDISNDVGANMGMGMGSLATSPLLRRILSRA